MAAAKHVFPKRGREKHLDNLVSVCVWRGGRIRFVFVADPALLLRIKTRKQDKHSFLHDQKSLLTSVSCFSMSNRTYGRQVSTPYSAPWRWLRWAEISTQALTVLKGARPTAEAACSVQALAWAEFEFSTFCLRLLRSFKNHANTSFLIGYYTSLWISF